MIADGGGEFKAELVQFLENLGVYVHITDAMAPHQNGRTERAGASLKGQLGKAQEPDSRSWGHTGNPPG